MSRSVFSKKLVLLLILSVVYCILSKGSLLATALPLLLFVFQFCDVIREKAVFRVLLIVLYVVICVVYVVNAFRAFQDPIKLCTCASILTHTMLFCKTFDFAELDNEFDFEDYPVKTVFYFIGIFALPLALQFIIASLEGTFLTVVTWIFIISAIGTAIGPFLLIKSALAPTAFTSGVYAKEGGSDKVERVAKRVANAMNIKVVSVRCTGSYYEITINTGAFDASTKEGLAQQFYESLHYAGMDVSKVNIRY